MSNGAPNLRLKGTREKEHALFRLVSGLDELGTYQFGTMLAKHHFCTVCGIHAYTRPRAAPKLYTINVRCLKRQLRAGLGRLQHGAEFRLDAF